MPYRVRCSNRAVEDLYVLHLRHSKHILVIILLPNAKQTSLSSDRPVSTSLYNDPDFYYGPKSIGIYGYNH